MIKKKIWLLLSLVILLIIGGWWIKKGEVREKAEQVVKVEEVEKAGQVKMVLDFGEGKISTYSANINLTNSPTVLVVLDQVTEENRLTLKTKKSDFGVLVEEIGGVKNSSDHFWLFYVNGQMAQVSADQYKLQPNDVAEWKYEKFKN